MHMIWIIMAPLMVFAVFLATAPVVYFTLREHRRVRSGSEQVVHDRATIFPRMNGVVGSTSERAPA
jgi:hypothetical protein